MVAARRTRPLAGILAVLASIFALSWAQNFVVPLLLGIVISYTLNPLVGWLAAIRIPRAIGTLIVLASVLGAIGFGTYSLRGEMQTIIDQLPEAATRFTAGLARIRSSQNDNLQTIQDAASKVENATARQPAARRGATRRSPPTSSWINRDSSSATSCGRVHSAPSEPWGRR